MIRVAVVDDQTLVREGIVGLLALSDRVAVRGEGADGDDALALVAAGEIDVLLLDLRMPRRDGIAVLEAMRERGRSEERRVGEEGRYDERREREEGEQEAESEHEDTA